MSNDPQDSAIMKTFQCPTCGTPLEIGTEPSIKCPSCGNTVLIPPKYRPQQPQPPQFVFQPVMPAFAKSSRGVPGSMLAPAAPKVIGTAMSVRSVER